MNSAKRQHVWVRPESSWKVAQRESTAARAQRHRARCKGAPCSAPWLTMRPMRHVPADLCSAGLPGSPAHPAALCPAAAACRLTSTATRCWAGWRCWRAWPCLSTPATRPCCVSCAAGLPPPCCCVRCCCLLPPSAALPSPATAACPPLTPPRPHIPTCRSTRRPRGAAPDPDRVRGAAASAAGAAGGRAGGLRGGRARRVGHLPPHPGGRRAAVSCGCSGLARTWQRAAPACAA